MCAQLWMIILMNALVQGMGSITNFFPTIVGALGYGTTETLLLTAPPYSESSSSGLR